MRRFDFIYLFVFGIISYSCQSVSVMPIDYLVPAEISFPDQIKRVGVVNNASQLPGRIEENAELDSLILVKSDGLIERYILNGDPKITTESLSESIAAEKYFDEVIIRDSALQVSGMPKNAPYLSKKEVNELTEDLDVDMLISLEEIQIDVQRTVHPMPGVGFWGNVDVKVYPKVNLYIPNRNTPLLTINGNDSIFWEDIESSKPDARTKIVPDKQLIAEASDFAGTIPVKYMTPRWRSAQRFFYSNGSSQMRDAGFFVQKENWDKALAIWETVYEQQKGRNKLRAASNISLYYEMKDDLDKAYEWGQIALELAKIADKISENDDVTIKHPTDYVRVNYNLSDLTRRRDNFMKLRVQMNRFNNDF